MPESSLVALEATALQFLEQISVERARAESDVEKTFRTRRESEERTFHDAQQRLMATSKSEIETTQAKYQSIRAGLVKQFDAEQKAAEAEYAEVRQKIASRAVSGKKAAKKAHEDTHWNTAAIYEAGKDGVLKRNKQREAEIAAAVETLQAIRDDSEATVALCHKYAADVSEETGEFLTLATDDPIPVLQETLKTADDQLAALAKLGLPKFLRPQQFIVPFLLLWLAAGVPLGIQIGSTYGIAADTVLAVALAVGARVWLTSIARRQVARLYPPFLRTLTRAEASAGSLRSGRKPPSNARKPRSGNVASAKPSRARRNTPGSRSRSSSGASTTRSRPKRNTPPCSETSRSAATTP